MERKTLSIPDDINKNGWPKTKEMGIGASVELLRNGQIADGKGERKTKEASNEWGTQNKLKEKDKSMMNDVF
ncbi:hypothetical protein NC651_035655 [Populus alba x Populus x berolinensis]|nr:hypothetical protein NC651_035655 [Populus alba x Populus x berolinensis]